MKMKNTIAILAGLLMAMPCTANAVYAASDVSDIKMTSEAVGASSDKKETKAITPGIWSVSDGEQLTNYIYFDAKGTDCTYLGIDSRSKKIGKYSFKNGKLKMDFGDGPVMEATVDAKGNIMLLKYSKDYYQILKYVEDTAPDKFDFMRDGEIIKLAADYCLANCCRYIPCESMTSNEDGTVTVYLSDGQSEDLHSYYIDRFTGKFTDEKGKKVNTDKTSSVKESYLKKGLWKSEAITEECADGYYWFGGNGEKSVCYDIETGDATEFSYRLFDKKGYAYIYDTDMFFTCSETDDGVELAWSTVNDGVFGIEKLTFISDAEKDEVVWNNGEITVNKKNEAVDNKADTAKTETVTATKSIGNDAYVKGDSNCDGQVDMSDIVLIMQALANPNKYGVNGTAKNHLTKQGELNADMNGDGLTVGDANEIQGKLLNKK